MRNPLRNKKVLITGGPTWVAIDPVRVIANRSTGQMAHLIAKRCAANRARVTVLRGPARQKKDLKGVRYRDFTFFKELQRTLNAELKKDYDVVIHAAAVADYRPQRQAHSKISSQMKRLPLKLVPTPKLIRSIKRRAPGVFLVGFKLEPRLRKEDARKKAEKLFQTARCDMVVANSDEGGRYKGFIIDKEGNVLSQAGSKEALAKELITALKELL